MADGWLVLGGDIEAARESADQVKAYLRAIEQRLPALRHVALALESPEIAEWAKLVEAVCDALGSYLVAANAVVVQLSDLDVSVAEGKIQLPLEGEAADAIARTYDDACAQLAAMEDELSDAVQAAVEGDSFGGYGVPVYEVPFSSPHFDELKQLAEEELLSLRDERTGFDPEFDGAGLAAYIDDNFEWPEED